MEKLTKLKSMLDMGILTQAEFDAKKQTFFQNVKQLIVGASGPHYL